MQNKDREKYLFRAACLREIQHRIEDPLARISLEALIQALEEAAADVDRQYAGPTAR